MKAMSNQFTACELNNPASIQGYHDPPPLLIFSFPSNPTSMPSSPFGQYISWHAWRIGKNKKKFHKTRTFFMGRLRDPKVAETAAEVKIKSNHFKPWLTANSPRNVSFHVATSVVWHSVLWLIRNQIWYRGKSFKCKKKQQKVGQIRMPNGCKSWWFLKAKTGDVGIFFVLAVLLSDKEMRHWHFRENENVSDKSCLSLRIFYPHANSILQHPTDLQVSPPDLYSFGVDSSFFYSGCSVDKSIQNAGPTGVSALSLGVESSG